MTPIEVNVLLTKAGLIDPFITPDADRAEEWAELLDDIDYQAALDAIRLHYRSHDERISPARIRHLVREGTAAIFARARTEFLTWAREHHGEYGVALPVPHNVITVMSRLRSDDAEVVALAIREMEDDFIARGHTWLADRREISA